tara:strand:+ start:1624 stop:2418 length:795 start_codon:yes stop_codon:yes gene_type:complete
MDKYFVIGNPIEHSLSPKLHNYWIKSNSLDAFYDKKKIDINELKDLIFQIKQKNIKGINVTVPYKRSVIPFLDKLSPEAEKTQSVNTIFLKDELIVGHNTDVIGFVNAVEKINFSLNNKKIYILGAGGVVPSIVFALNKMNVLEINLANRTKQKALDLKKSFGNLKIVDWGLIPDFDVIINATSVGLNKEDLIDLDFSKIGKNRLFYDVIYNPSETNFLKTGKQSGNLTENGKLMFLHQASEAFKLWHGISPKINSETIRLLND